MHRWLIILLAWVAIAPVARPAETLPPKPARYFNDYANAVSPSVGDNLNRELEDFERQTSNQVVVAIFPKMESNSSIEDYANRVFNSWQVGQADKKNGAVLFVFVQDHKMRIEVGYGLEGALPDALAKRILDDEITPRFKNNDFNGGITAGVNAMLAAVKGEYKGTGKTVAERHGNGPSGGVDITDLVVPVFIAFFIITALARTLKKTGTVYTRNGRRVYNSSPNIWWWGGGGGGGGFGGGFGGGGGGGFSGGGGSSGGGGASGSW